MPAKITILSVGNLHGDNNNNNNNETKQNFIHRF